MPHDANGQLIQVGDRVNVPMVVTMVTSGDDGYCNCTLESELLMPGNGTKTTLSAINTRQVVKPQE